MSFVGAARLPVLNPVLSRPCDYSGMNLDVCYNLNIATGVAAERRQVLDWDSSTCFAKNLAMGEAVSRGMAVIKKSSNPGRDRRLARFTVDAGFFLPRGLLFPGPVRNDRELCAAIGVDLSDSNDNPIER